MLSSLLSTANGRYVVSNLFELVSKPESIPWKPHREGTEIHWIHRSVHGGPSCALIRFHPGAKIPTHEHPGFEHILVLSGSEADEGGLVSRGDLLIHEPGTQHSVYSKEGCIVLAFYERPVVFVKQG